MRKVPNNVFQDLIKILPVLIENVPKNDNVRLLNATRKAIMIVKKLKKLETTNLDQE